jgi:hypothetical protein
MKWSIKKNVSIQATVALLLLLSAGISAVHPTTVSMSTKINTVESTFHFGDVPFITVSVTPSSLVYGQRLLSGQTFATMQLPGEGLSTVIGEAQLPTISRFIEIPQGANPELLIESVSWETTSLQALQLPSKIVPVQPSLVKIEGASVTFTMNDPYYATNALFPSPFVTVNSIGELRERNIAFLEISPVQYNPASGDLRIMTQCVLRINLPGSDLALTTEKIDRYTTPSFEQLFETSFINYGSLQGTQNIRPRQEGYLIIVYDAFFDEIQPLATLKDSKGFDVIVTKTSEIPSGPTKENIKAYIVDAYNNWPVPPAYVLLVGDVAQIPAWTGSSTGTCTDLYYATIDTDNYFADVIISRFPAATPEQVTAMVDKTVFYEVGMFSNESWIKKAAFMASTDNWDVSEGTHNYVIDTYLIPNNYTCDKLYTHTYGATTQSVRDALNNGRSLAVYSGHGGTDYWADGPVFHQSDVNGLTNDGMYPLVCSHACITGTFSSPECFGETWLRAPNKAGLAFWGASDNTYWDEDDLLEKSMFKAWWEDNLENIGGMTNMGLYYLYQFYGGGGMSQYYFEAYNVLGDSSVKIWRGQSNVNTPPVIPEKPNGPTTGEIGIEYTFTTSTTDAQDNDVFYMVSWGDSVSDWLGPYSSGATVELKHTWALVGDYSITVKAKDGEGLESDWSETSTISIVAVPRIEIGKITGSFGSLSAEIKNVGAGEASNVAWSISFQGGLVLLGRDTTGTITKIIPGFAPKAKTGFVFGFGSVDILVTAGDAEKAATARLIGPFFLSVS